MNFIIVFLLPSILALKTYINLNKENKLSLCIINYLLFVLFSNYIAMLILMIFKGEVINLVAHAENDYIFCVKYITLSILINIILSIVATIVEKYISFEIEVENGRKKNKK